jgi:hypothetical protein
MQSGNAQITRDYNKDIGCRCNYRPVCDAEPVHISSDITELGIDGRPDDRQVNIVYDQI